MPVEVYRKKPSTLVISELCAWRWEDDKGSCVGPLFGATQITIETIFFGWFWKLYTSLHPSINLHFTISNNTTENIAWVKDTHYFLCCFSKNFFFKFISNSQKNYNNSARNFWIFLSKFPQVLTLSHSALSFSL